MTGPSCIPCFFLSPICCHDIAFEHLSFYTAIYSAFRAAKGPPAPGSDEAISGSQASYVILSGPLQCGLRPCSPQGQRQDSHTCGFCLVVRAPRPRKARGVQAVARTWQLLRHLPKIPYPACIGLNVITGASDSLPDHC